MVHGKLKENLSGKRFLLVLDDVWNKRREKWEVVQTPLKYGAQGSRILVTTHSKKVAFVMWSNEVHHLEQLREDHCWQVFAKHAFQEDNSQLNGELKEVGIKIVDKCKGLPLALKTIRSLLHTKSSVSEWESVLISKIWELPKEDGEIVPALLLSYHHLPSHLKKCFAYCALFPKDYEFDKKSLVLLWMAESFIQCTQQSKSPEEVGEQYFDDLLLRSFFQQSSRYKTCYFMHDLLNELAKYVCGDICFRLGIDPEKSAPKMTRHFSFAVNHIQYFDGFGSLYDAKRLRTFMPIGKMILRDGWHCKMLIHELFSKFKFLRVLSLSRCSGLIGVPDSVGNLIHLRSLDLSSTDIIKLPNSTCLLYNLEILKLSFCYNLEDLPSNLHKLTNLRCLEFKYTKVRKVPVHLGKLKKLQVLSSFYVGNSSELTIQQLGELNLHGRLSIGDLQNIENPSDALAANLKNKIHLLKLDLNWNWNHNQIPDDPRKEKEVLENLQPSKHLKKLSIWNYGGTQFPSWLWDSSSLNVMSLSLVNCKYCLCLPPLGLLPFLKDLTIRRLDGVVGIDADFYGSSSSSFTSLETLHFSDMKEWEEWECKSAKGAFSRLQDLSIVGCPKLKGQLPEQLFHLKKLDIRGCKKHVASVPRAPEICELELANCGKLQFDYHPTTLKRLAVGGHDMEASSLESIGHIISDTFLKDFHIYDLPNMNISISHCYNFLETLVISGGCDSLVTFPLDFFPKLRSLDLRCPNLQMILQEHVHCHLKHLIISGCPQFESFPSEGLSAPWLESFRIEVLESLKSLPERMHILLPSLGDLHIKDCPRVESFPDGGLPSNLKWLDLSNCYKLSASLKGALGASMSLKTLSIEKLYGESFPDDGMLPHSLKLLEIRYCLNLKKLDYKGLCQLSYLEELLLDDCPSLQCLPEEGLPKSISTLRILGNCPLLKQHCQKPEGKDWGTIAHIENIWADDKQIR